MSENQISLFNLLNDSDYYLEDNGEFIITIPNIEATGSIIIDFPCHISSNCSTNIKCKAFHVNSGILHLNSLNFDATIIASGTQELSISNCTIKGNDEFKGSVITNSCELVTLNNVIIKDSNNTNGLYIINSIVTADNLSIHHLNKSLLAIENESFLTLTNSHLHHSESNAIEIYDHSRIEISNCHFSDTKGSTIYVNDSNCSVKNSSFENSERFGINFVKSNDFFIEDNKFSNISKCAIMIQENSRGTVDKNTFIDINGNGVTAFDSDVLIKNNVFNRIKIPAIGIGVKSAASIQFNKISNIDSNAISIRSANHAEVEGCEIDNAKFSGISASDTNSVFIHNNKISDCLIAGIEAFNESKIKAENNIINNCKKFAFVVFASGFINATKNVINSINEAMVRLLFNGGGDFIENKISNCPKQCFCETTSFYFLAKNGNFPSVTNDVKRCDDSIILDDSVISENPLCIKCHKNKRDVYLLNCGHKVLCKNCAEENIKNKEICPLCRYPIDDYLNGVGGSDDGLCSICFENRADCIVTPCGHIGACSSCLESWFKNKKICPFCRKDESSYTRIFNL